MPLHTRTDLLLDSPAQLKALSDPTRAQILRVLQDGPASAKGLSTALEMTHGKVGHHLNVLRRAGLIEVVETRPVRAVTEKFYGLTFHRLTMDERLGDRLQFVLAQAAREALPSASQTFDPPGMFVTIRLPPEKAEEINRRLKELVEAAVAADESDGEPHGLVVSLFKTDTPAVEQQ